MAVLSVQMENGEVVQDPWAFEIEGWHTGVTWRRETF